MWTVRNVSQASVAVNDVPDAQVVAPGDTAQFQVGDFSVSQTLATSIASGALCVIAYGDFVPLGAWAPVTFTAQPAPSVQQTASGYSLPMSLGPYQKGLVLLNVTALGGASSVAIGFQPYDGAAYYPSQPVIAAVSAVGPVAQAFDPSGLAGRLTWTVAGTATFSLLWQLR